MEPLDFIAEDAKLDLAVYAKENDLLDKPGWIRFRDLAKNEKKTLRLIKQARLRSFQTAPKYMYGFKIPKNYNEAVELDVRNGNTKWQDSTDLEMSQLKDYKTFIDKGEFHASKIPKGYKKINMHLIYAVKHDGRFKARLVAGGHLTDTPIESVYSGVSLRGRRTIIFLGELNDIEPWATDIGNAYLEATTTEKVCIRAGFEFGELK